MTKYEFEEITKALAKLKEDLIEVIDKYTQETVDIISDTTPIED